MRQWPHRYEVVSVIIPEDRAQMLVGWQKTGGYAGPNDIALFKLDREVTFIPQQIVPVCLCFYSQFINQIYFLIKRFVLEEASKMNRFQPGCLGLELLGQQVIMEMLNAGLMARGQGNMKGE